MLSSCSGVFQRLFAWAVVVLSDKLLHRRGPAIDPAALCDAALGLYRLDHILGQGHIAVKYLSACLKLPLRLPQ